MNYTFCRIHMVICTTGQNLKNDKNNKITLKNQSESIQLMGSKLQGITGNIMSVRQIARKRGCMRDISVDGAIFEHRHMLYRRL